MKFNDYDPVVVTEVPPLAMPYVRVGDPGIIQPIEHPEHKVYADDLGLVKVRINNFTFWWSAKHLDPAAVCCGKHPVSKPGAECSEGAGGRKPAVKLTIIDEAHYIPWGLSLGRKRLSVFTRDVGYDPYNTAEAYRYAVRWSL